MRVLDQQVVFTASRGLVGVQHVSEVSAAEAESFALMQAIDSAREENGEIMLQHAEAKKRKEEAERLAREAAEEAERQAAAEAAAAAGKKGKGAAPPATPPPAATEPVAEPAVQITESEIPLPDVSTLSLLPIRLDPSRLSDQ